MKRPTLEWLREHLQYYPDSGSFVWIKRPKKAHVVAGTEAGCLQPHGYVCIGRQKAHRLAWLYVHGVWPAGEVDHINGNRSDNRLANLRVCTRAENGRNRGMHKPTASGTKGVRLKSGRWEAQIMHCCKPIYLGRFSTKEEAVAAYAAASVQFHGEFGRVA